MSTIDPDGLDRVVKLVLDAGDADTPEQASALLATYRLQVIAGKKACMSAPGQAALLTAVATGVRALHGGVTVKLSCEAECVVPLMRGQPLTSAVRAIGGGLVDKPETSIPTIVLGDDQQTPESRGVPCVWASADGWIATVAPTPPAGADGRAGELPAAILSASLAVAEVFQNFRGLPLAGERELSLSLWDPGTTGAQGPPIALLPSSLWLLGLGHLGQAYAWVLGMLPYPPDPGTLVLQDADRLSPANRATSVLYDGQELGTPKTRVVATALERAGWDTHLVERRHYGGRLRGPQDPLVLLGGVDNPDTRRSYDQSGFPVIYDAGLGSGPDGYLGITVRRLPAKRPSSDLWDHRRGVAAPLPERAQAAYETLARESGDRCGVETLASRTVATAFVGVSAATIVLGGLLRELHGGERLELVDLTLRDPRRAQVIRAAGGAPARITSVPRAHE